MKRYLPPVGLACLLLVATFLPVATAKPLDAYTVVGTDPKADGQLLFATGVAYPAAACGTGFGCDKYDILQLEAGTDADSLHIKLTPGASYWGTSGLIYAVHFEAAGKKYFVCWNIHSGGTTGNNEDIQENTLACSRFTGETEVGPATRADGVTASTDAGKVFVDWGVPLSSLGGAAQLSSVVAEIWARGPSICCAGSTTQSQYLWNLADRAPDKGAWTYTAGGAPAGAAANLTLSGDRASGTVEPGGNTTFALTAGLDGTGSENATFSASGLPSGWSGAFEPPAVTLSGGNASSSNFTVSAPSDASPQTLNVTVTLAGASSNATVNLTLTVAPASSSASAAPTGASHPSTGPASASPTATNETAAAKEAKSAVPSPSGGVALLSLAGAALAVAMRRRRA